MALNLGKASLVLGVQNRLKGGLDQAEALFEGFKVRMRKGLDDKKDGAFKGGLNALYGEFQGISSWMKTLGDGGFAGRTGGKFLSDALDTAKALAEVGKKAQAVGAGTAEFMGLAAEAKKAHVETDEFAAVMGKFAAKAGQAQLGGGDAAATFAQLGISMDALGKNTTTDQKFRLVADAISAIPDEGLQATFALKLFEEQGLKLLPMLQKGGDKLTEFMQKQADLGVALGDADMAKLMRVKDALPKVEAVFTGAWNKIVVAVSPLLEALAERTAKNFERAQPVINAAVGGIEVAARIAAAAYDELSGFGAELQASAGAWLLSVTGAEDLGAAVKQVVTDAAAVVLKLGADFGSFLSYAAGWWADLGGQAAAATADVADWLRDSAARVAEAAAPVLAWVGRQAAAVGEVLGQLGQYAADAAGWVLRQAGAVLGAFGELAARLGGAVGEAVGGLSAAVGERLAAVGEAALKMLGDLADGMMFKLRMVAAAAKALATVVAPSFVSGLDALLDGSLSVGLRGLSADLGKVGAAFAGLSARMNVSLGSLHLWIGKALAAKDALADPMKAPKLPIQPVTGNFLTAAVEKGTVAEYSARVKAEFSGQNLQQQMLDQLKQINQKSGKAPAAPPPAAAAGGPAVVLGEV